MIEAGLPCLLTNKCSKLRTPLTCWMPAAISVTERQRFILRVRTLARAVAEAYYNAREALGFPMLQQDKVA